jgi:hypothetical protein
MSYCVPLVINCYLYQLINQDVVQWCHVCSPACFKSSTTWWILMKFYINICQSLCFLIYIEFVGIKTWQTHKHVKCEQHWHFFQNAVIIMTKQTQEQNLYLTLLIYKTTRSILNAKLRRMRVETVHCIKRASLCSRNSFSLKTCPRNILYVFFAWLKVYFYSVLIYW